MIGGGAPLGGGPDTDCGAPGLWGGGPLRRGGKLGPPGGPLFCGPRLSEKKQNKMIYTNNKLPLEKEKNRTTYSINSWCWVH